MPSPINASLTCLQGYMPNESNFLLFGLNKSQQWHRKSTIPTTRLYAYQKTFSDVSDDLVSVLEE
jgi:hypothetical protein